MICLLTGKQLPGVEKILPVSQLLTAEKGKGGRMQLAGRSHPGDTGDSQGPHATTTKGPADPLTRGTLCNPSRGTAAG